MLIHTTITKQRVITKKQVKNEQIKKHACSVSFVKVSKLRDNKFKIAQKNFQEITIK